MKLKIKKHKAITITKTISHYSSSILLTMICIICIVNNAVAQPDYLKFGYWAEDDHLTVFNPSTGVNEDIYVTVDGRIEHRPHGGGDIYTDHAMIFRTQNGFFKYATFAKGYWMVRPFNNTTKRPTAEIETYTAFIDNEGFTDLPPVFNCAFVGTGRNECFGTNDGNFSLHGLPNQNYINVNDEGGFGAFHTGSLFTNSGNETFQFLKDEGQLTSYTKEEMQAINWGSADFPYHVLPAETNKIQIKIKANSIAANWDEFADIELFASKNPFTQNFFLSFDDTLTTNSTKIYYDGSYAYHEFDISDLQKFNTPVSLEGGPIFLAFRWRIFNGNLIDCLKPVVWIPVMLERTTQDLTPFVDADGVTQSRVTGPVELQMVLHDPPGDNSYASYAVGTEVCTTTEYSSGSGSDSNYDNRIQVGFSGSAGAGVSANIEVNVGFSFNFSSETMQTSTNTMENCFRINETVSTAGNPAFGEGDRFLGIANTYEMYYGKRIFWNEGDINTDGAFVDSTGLYLEIVEQTIFDKSEKQIRDEIIQAQATLANLPPKNPSNNALSFQRNILIQSIEILYDMLTDNQAVRVDPDILPEGPAPGNITSISAGPKTVTSETAETASRTETFEVITAKQFGLDQTVLIAGSGYEGSQSWGSTKTTSNSSGRQSGNTITHTYHLEDVNASRADGIELTNVTEHIDPRFGNSFFRVTPDSRTSCPYEGGQRTEQPNLKSKISIAYPNESNHVYVTGAPAGEPLQIPIDLCNLFSFNDQLKTGNFILNYEDGTGGGAQVEIQQNVELEDEMYDFDYGSCYGDEGNQQLQVVRVTQADPGDVCYDDANNNAIRLTLNTVCNDGTSDVMDVLNISVCFTTNPNTDLNMNAECEALSNIDHALNFDGIDDHVEVYHQAQPFTFNDFSYEFWAKPNKQVNLNDGESNNVGNQSSASTIGGTPFAIFPTNGVDMFDLTDTIIGSEGQIKAGIAVGINGVQVVEHYDGPYEGADIIHSPVVLSHAMSINEWTHIAVVYKKRLPTLYINGVFAKVGLRSEFNGVHPGLQLGGGLINGQPNFFGGTLDELRVYSYARTEAQILADKNNRSTGSEGETMLIFRFDSQTPGAANAGASLNDLSGTLDPEDIILQNFDYGANSSNWVTGRVAEFCSTYCPESLDPDSDALTDCEDLCPNDRDTALDFDAESPDPDYIEVAHDPTLNVMNQFTFEAWVNPTSGGYKTILSKGHGSTAQTNYIFGIMADDDTFFGEPGRLGLYLSDGTNANWYHSNTAILQNTWTHVAVTVNRGQSDLYEIKLYINGVEDAVSLPFISAGLYSADSNPLYIGRQGFGCQCNPFDGRMDEVAIWDKALTAADVLASIAAPYTGTEPGLVAYYDFNDNDACVANGNTTLVDKANGHNGILTNFSLTAGCESNWTSGHNMGACPATSCPPALDLTGTASGNINYTSGSYISSDQVIVSPAQVDYDASTEITLLENFEVKAGAIFHAFIDGCGTALRHVQEFVK